jgi:hypothetical protein
MDSMQSSAFSFGIELHVLAFRWLFFWAKPDMSMIWTKAERYLIKDDDELRPMMFDGMELAQ